MYEGADGQRLICGNRDDHVYQEAGQTHGCCYCRPRADKIEDLQNAAAIRIRNAIPTRV